MTTEERQELDKLMASYSATINQKMEAIETGQKGLTNDLQTKLEKQDQDITARLDKFEKSVKKMQADLREVEQNEVASTPVSLETDPRSAGEIFTASEAFEKSDEADPYTPPVQVGSILSRPQQTAIVNATGQNQPLVPDQRVAGIMLPTGLRVFTIRDLVPVARTTSNLIQFTRENVFTDNAAPQYSSPSYENVTKGESGITFTLLNAAVQTIAHWIPASRQVLSDAPQLRGHIDMRLMYGLLLEEEEQLLLGDGTGANLEGLVTAATAYDTTLNVTGDTNIDKLRHAVLQLIKDSEFPCDGFVLNHEDWHDIELIKQATEKGYIFADPHLAVEPRIWGRRVVPTNTMTSGYFLAGSFALAAQIWDRWNATIQVSREHSDYFVKNMVAILAEERIALTIYRPKAIVYGAF